MLEKRIESYLTQQIHRRGGLSYKFVSPGQPGVPDRIIVLPGGRVVFVELKADRGRLAQIQKWQLDRLRALGADVRTVQGRAEVCALVKELSRDGI